MMETFVFVVGVIGCVGLFIGGLALAVVVIVDYGTVRDQRQANVFRVHLRQAYRDKEELAESRGRILLECGSLREELDAANREIETLRGIHAVDTAYLERR